jgi:hypothetical protein
MMIFFTKKKDNKKQSKTTHPHLHTHLQKNVCNMRLYLFRRRDTISRKSVKERNLRMAGFQRSLCQRSKNQLDQFESNSYTFERDQEPIFSAIVKDIKEYGHEKETNK